MSTQLKISIVKPEHREIIESYLNKGDDTVLVMDDGAASLLSENGLSDGDSVDINVLMAEEADNYVAMAYSAKNPIIEEIIANTEQEGK
ncbi:hypothetical protein DZF79_28700 [Vibrio parahaemolyticus]|nr:hypothetical protein [Vibrio parahaemolyticus]